MWFHVEPRPHRGLEVQVRMRCGFFGPTASFIFVKNFFQGMEQFMFVRFVIVELLLKLGNLLLGLLKC
jgi:hypothetical protein